MRKRLLLLGVWVIITVTGLNIAIFAAQTLDARSASDQGWVTLKSQTNFGGHLLSPGTYYLSHEGGSEFHFVSFQRVSDPILALQYANQLMAGPPVSAACHILHLPGRVKHTVVTVVPDGAGQRITRIEIKGETVAHVF